MSLSIDVQSESRAAAITASTTRVGDGAIEYPWGDKFCKFPGGNFRDVTPAAVEIVPLESASIHLLLRIQRFSNFRITFYHHR